MPHYITKAVLSVFLVYHSTPSKQNSGPKLVFFVTKITIFTSWKSYKMYIAFLHCWKSPKELKTFHFRVCKVANIFAKPTFASSIGYLRFLLTFKGHLRSQTMQCSRYKRKATYYILSLSSEHESEARNLLDRPCFPVEHNTSSSRDRQNSSRVQRPLDLSKSKSLR